MSSNSQTDKNKLDAAQPLLQMIIDGMVESVLVIDTEQRVVLANKAAQEHIPPDHKPNDPLYCYQVSHQRNKPCTETEEVNHVCPLQAVLETKKPVTVVHDHITYKGKKYAVELTASPIMDQDGSVTAIIEVCRDITERLLLEEKNKKLLTQLFEQQKDESITTLAAGVAHDFNNNLTTVIGNAELIKMEIGLQNRVGDFADAIVSSADRMARLTSRLLDYAKKGKHQPRELSLNSLIKNSLELVHKGRALETEVALDLAKDIWPVYADLDQMRQMFIDIFSNAFEAMAGSKGCLSIRLFNQMREEEWECDLGDAPPAGDYVGIRVSDTGPGIPKEVLGRIFEPFFTTKFMGRGLGLAAAKGIVVNHGGCMSVESVYGEGATFYIYLPRSKRGLFIPEGVKATKKIRWGKILVIDDEPMVQNVLKKMLHHQAFEVETAGSGREALDIIAREEKNIKLVILDIQMPEINGIALYNKLKEMHLDLRILIASGYDEEMVHREINLTPEDGFIQKPFTLKALKVKVSELMDVKGLA